MNWDAVGALAELVGASGVILSLVYLARQIGQNTKSVRVASYQSWFSSYDSLSNMVLSNAELDALIHRGGANPDSLSDEEMQRYRGTLRRMCRQFENLGYQYAEGMIDPELYRNWERVLPALVETHGFRIFWDQEQEFFGEQFRRAVDDIRAA